MLFRSSAMACGLLVKPRDPQAIADALERLYDDPQLGQRLGQVGREKVRRAFDLNANAAALAQRFSAEIQPCVFGCSGALWGC